MEEWEGEKDTVELGEPPPPPPPAEGVLVRDTDSVPVPLLHRVGVVDTVKLPVPDPLARAVGLKEGEGVEDREEEGEWVGDWVVVAHLEVVEVREEVAHMEVVMQGVGEVV